MKKITLKVEKKICKFMQVGDAIGLEASGVNSRGVEWTHTFWRGP